jgi:Tfp pilus assembly protein PilW
MVELMVAMSIAMVLIAAILSSYTFLGRNLVRFSNQQQLEAQSRRMLQTFSQDVRMADTIANTYNSTSNITLDSSWQTTPTPGQVAFRISVPNGGGGIFIYAVTYSYDGTSTLTRTVSSGPASGTPPPDFNTIPMTLLTGASSFSFNYLDKQGTALTAPIYPSRIKQIEASGLMLSSGTANSGTQSRFTFASARVVLRNRHLVN